MGASASIPLIRAPWSREVPDLSVKVLRMSEDGETPMSDLFLPALHGGLSLIQRRVLRAQIEIQAQDAAKVLYQHTVLCQAVMPYRDPGPDARLWHRVQGNA